MLPSGFQAKFTNRVAWAATHLNKANAINRVGRGRYVITSRGKQLLASGEPVTLAVLAKFPEYQVFKSGDKASQSRGNADRIRRLLHRPRQSRRRYPRSVKRSALNSSTESSLHPPTSLNG